METKYGSRFSKATESSYKKILVNMIYKLLPMRDNGEDWDNYLSSLIIEISGAASLLGGSIGEVDLLRILSKLEGLLLLTQEVDFYKYRKTVLECTNLIK